MFELSQPGAPTRGVDGYDFYHNYYLIVIVIIIILEVWYPLLLTIDVWPEIPTTIAIFNDPVFDC